MRAESSHDCAVVCDAGECRVLALVCCPEIDRFLFAKKPGVEGPQLATCACQLHCNPTLIW